jgi:hypothetical protein
MSNFFFLLQSNKTMGKNRINIQAYTTEKYHLYGLIFAKTIIQTPIKHPYFATLPTLLVTSDLSYLIATKSYCRIL